MDEHGSIDAITWIAIMNVFFWKDKTCVTVLFPVVSWKKSLMSMIFGLTPFAVSWAVYWPSG
jgi:hypothetical protein